MEFVSVLRILFGTVTMQASVFVQPILFMMEHLAIACLASRGIQTPEDVFVRPAIN
jgi:hypothetical protein